MRDPYLYEDVKKQLIRCRETITRNIFLRYIRLSFKIYLIGRVYLELFRFIKRKIF